MERIIDVYYARDNLPYKDEARTIHFPVAGSEFLGASQTTTIRFHYEQIGTDENVYTVESKRPDGKTGSQLLSKNTTEHYAEMSLSGWYSECKGDLFLSLKVYRGGTTATYNESTQLWEVSGVPVIESTGAIKLAINYTPMGRYENYNDAVETFQQVLAALGDKLDTIKGIVGVSGLSQVDTTEYEEGQLFFDVDTKNIYKLESGEFIKINNKLEIVDVSGYEYEELFAMFGTQPFMSYFGETNNISVYQFKEITGGYELHCSSQKNGLVHIPSVVLTNTFSTSDFTQLDFQSAPVVELQSETGTLSDLDYEKVLQPNATISYNNKIYTKTNEDEDYVYFANIDIDINKTEGITEIRKRVITLTKSTQTLSYSLKSDSFYNIFEIVRLLAQKQDKLVSGTNIKTLTIGDNQPVSLLGSGTINIPTGGSGGSAEWGSIGGDIADQTDLQNELQDIREVAEGKTNTYVISDDIEGLTEQTFVANEYERADGTPIATWADFLSYIDDTRTCSNKSFDNDSVYKIDIGYTYFITVYNRIIKTKTLKNGDNIYVVQLNVPDRWYNEEDYCAYPLETSKVNLDNYSTNSETSTEVNKVAHDIAVEYDENTLYGSGDLCIKDKLLYKCNTDNTTGTWDSTKWDLTTVNSELGIIKGNYVDLASAQTISGVKTFSNGVNNNIFRDTSGTQYLEFTSSLKVSSSRNIVPNGSKYIGESNNSWARGYFVDLYLSGGINPNTNGYKLTFPDTTSLTANSELVDTTSEQTITGEKTFANVYVNTIYTADGIHSNNQWNSIGVKLGSPIDTYQFDNSAFNPFQNGAKDLGKTSQRWRDLFLSRYLSDGTNSVSVADISNGLFNVINASDIQNNQLSPEQFNLITNGKPTLIKGSFGNRRNMLILGVAVATSTTRLKYVSFDSANEYREGFYSINNTTLVISEVTGDILISNLRNIMYINGIAYAQYYKKPQSSYSLSDGGTITDATLKTLIQNEQPIKLNGFTCYFSCGDGTNYQYVSTRYDAVANKNHINVITINKTTWIATFHTSDIAV